MADGQMEASNWIFNHPHIETGMDLFPFVEQSSDVISRDQQLQCLKIPNVNMYATRPVVLFDTGL